MNKILIFAYILLNTNFGVWADWKIVNGSQAMMREYPQIVSIRVEEDHSCGGTLLNGDTVLTAAHCVFDYMNWTRREIRQKIKVVLGEYDLKRVYGDEKVFQVTEMIIPKTYTKEPSYYEGNDVALIKFDGYVSKYAYDHLKYTTLDKEGKFKPGDRCEVIGWGSMLRRGTDTARFLQKASVQIITNEECAKTYKDVQFTTTNICAGAGFMAIAACRGDSGGPLFCSDGFNHHIQVGIVSYGKIPCGRPNVPNVYTRIADVADWIELHS